MAIKIFPFHTLSHVHIRRHTTRAIRNYFFLSPDGYLRILNQTRGEGGRQILPTKEFGHMNMIAMSLILDENWIVLFQFSKPSVQTGSLCDCSLCHGRGGCFVANETGVPFKTIHPPGWRARVEGPVTQDLQVWLNWKIIIMIIKAVLSLKEEH